MRDRAWIVIARREFVERVRTRWFVIVTLLGPIGMIALLVVPAWLSNSTDDRVRIKVVDKSHVMSDRIAQAAALSFPNQFVFETVSTNAEEDDLREDIREQKINGFLVVPDNVLDSGMVIYRGDNATNFGFNDRLERAIAEALLRARADRKGIDPAVVTELTRPPAQLFAQHDTGTGEATSAAASFLVGYIVMFILYMSILLYAVNVMRSVVQEKTSRVIEIVVSATKPRSLMLGKVIGVGCVGLLQLSIWAGVGLLLITLRGQILGAFGVEGAEGFAMPPLAIGDAALSLLYFLLGYFFYSSLYAAIGAMVNSDQEAQQAQTPVVLLLIIPVACVQLVANDPRGGAAQLLTMIPFSSPVLMPMRYLLGGATPAEVALSLGILALSMAAAIALAARIYRVGILMYGKRPTLREVARWIRH
ncbi:MAG TPA: ABC transporter permease, partial [Kofleriaceae bacterium]|nr:ABC transporter permease [Kofleriaceae bacterium]